MSDEIAVELRGVTKDYRREGVATAGIKTVLLHLPAHLRGLRKRADFRALSDVSLQIKRGECFGIIGRNGAGKSTMLGLIAGVLKPNQGSVRTFGRISPLLELGAGFNMELTGRENVMLNSVLLGMTLREVRSRMQSIVNFAELEEFIDQPIRSYSTGMIARLGFAVAVHIDPEILLVDEVLAVGDEAFQAKSFARMRQFHYEGVTTVFVSHSMSMVEQICDRVGVIEGSRLAGVGPPVAMIELYRSFLAIPREPEGGPLASGENPSIS